MDLTALCLRFNPANYTVWWYRRQILSTLSKQDKRNNNDNTIYNSDTNGKDLVYYELNRIKHDLDLASELGGSNPKNYQLWYHRRSLLEYTFETRNNIITNTTDNILQDELEYIANVLDEDAKNYHAWSHRQWILKTINDSELWSNELDYLDTLIENDIRNNSAWNQRWFASHHGLYISVLSIEHATREAEYAIKHATIDPHNESPLRYLVALLKEQMKHLGKYNNDTITSFMKYVEKEIETIIEVLDRGNDCPSLISAYIDVLEIKNDPESLLKCADMANDLGTKFDVVRKKYWSMREEKLRSKAQRLQTL